VIIFSYRAETLGEAFDLRAACEAAGIVVVEDEIMTDPEWDDEYDDDDEWGDGYDETVTVDHLTAAEIHEPLPVELYCLAKRPDGIWCMRMRGHDGDHSAYTRSISQPETWSTQQGGDQL
jgi:hypothetical protein